MCNLSWHKKIRDMPMAVAALLIILTMGLKLLCPQMAQALRPWLIGREDNRVLQAFSALTDTMERGPSALQAVEVFCMEIIGETEIS